MLTKITDDGLYLDVAQLSVGCDYKKVCLVRDVKSGMTVYQDGYYTFYVKDCNANIIAARLFNPKDFLEDGFDAMYLKGKPVQMEFTAQIYNGSWSCIVHSISVYTGDFDFARFYGIAPAVDYEFLNKVYSHPVTPNFYSGKRLSAFCDGRVDGVAKIFESATRILMNYAGVIDSDRLFKDFNKAFDGYVRYKQQEENFGLATAEDVVKLLQPLLLEDDSGIIIEAFYALIGMQEPKNLYAHAIADAVGMAIKMFHLIYLEKAMPCGSTLQFDGGILVKY